MNTKHTRGPWHWDSDPIKGDPLGRVRYRVTALGKTVTQCYYSSSDECAEHDARLIAASPDLLEALQMVRMLRQLGGMLPGSHQIVQTVVEAAEAAIAQATGEEREQQ